MCVIKLTVRIEPKKFSGLLKDWWSICLFYSFSCFNSEGHKRLSRLFSGNLQAMFLFFLNPDVLQACQGLYISGLYIYY